MEIGRKIYYELSTGNVIVDTGERQGNVVETTEEQDFALYAMLSKYQQSAVGVMQLSYGENAENFSTYPYHIDVTQAPNAIVWDTSAPIGATLADAQAEKVAQINNFCAQKIDAGYNSYAEGSKDGTGKPVALLYKSDASHQADMGMELYLAQQHKAGNLAAYPCTWKDASISGPCHNVSDDIIIQLYTEMGVHILWCKTMADTLVAATQAAATTDAVNAIAWPTEPAPTAPAAS